MVSSWSAIRVTAASRSLLRGTFSCIISEGRSSQETGNNMGKILDIKVKCQWPLETSHSGDIFNTWPEA